MKKTNVTFFLLFFLLSSIFFPVIFVSADIVPAEDDSTMIYIVEGDGTYTAWGPTTWAFGASSSTMVGGQGGSPKGMTLEKFWEIRETTVFPYFEYVPVLATGYDVVEYYPEETNSYGWTNKDGIKVMNITLRENVLFHDGSEWNATVAKWNIDRAYVLTGNLTGSEGDGHSDIMGHMTFKPGPAYEPFYTPSWNHSSTYNNDLVNGLPEPPQYYGKDNDPNLSWTNVSRTYIADGHYSIFNKTLVVKDASQTASGTGGTIQIEFNDWVTDLRLVAWIAMISMEQYGDMFYTQIYDEFDLTGDDLACGTGTYKALSVDKVDGIFYMERNDDYWDYDGLRAEGKMIVKDGIISMVVGADAGQTITTALIAGDADVAVDGPYGELYEDQLKNSTILEYIDTGTADSIEQIDFIQQNTDLAFRKAISYAFNYTQYLVNVKEGNAIRCDNLMGMNSVYIDDTVVGSYHDLTIARATLLNDATYGAILSGEGITASSTTAEWNTFADNVGSLSAADEELFTFNFLHDIYGVDLTSILETSIADIGIVLNKSGATPADPYGNWKFITAYGMWIPMLYDRPNQYARDLEGFLVDWPMPKTDLGYLDAFYVYTSQWSDAASEWSVIPDTWNWGLINDPTLAEYIRGLYFEDDAGRLDLYSDIQVRTATITYPSMFISQDKQGRVHNKKWDVDWYWGGFDFAQVSPGPGPSVAPIPGFSMIPLFIFSAISIVAIGYTIKRKKK